MTVCLFDVSETPALSTWPSMTCLASVIEKQTMRGTSIGSHYDVVIPKVDLPLFASTAKPLQLCHSARAKTWHLRLLLQYMINWICDCVH